jgi:uncharacterized protein YjbI with pentapeptide repeats
MRRFAIRHKYTGYNLYEADVPETVDDDKIREYLLKKAVKEGVDLSGAELSDEELASIR